MSIFIVFAGLKNRLMICLVVCPCVCVYVCLYCVHPSVSPFVRPTVTLELSSRLGVGVIRTLEPEHPG